MKKFLELFGVALLAYGEMVKTKEGLVIPVLADEGKGFKMIGYVDGNDAMRLEIDKAKLIMEKRLIVPLNPGIMSEINSVLKRNKEREV